MKKCLRSVEGREVKIVMEIYDEMLEYVDDKILNDVIVYLTNYKMPENKFEIKLRLDDPNSALCKLYDHLQDIILNFDFDEEGGFGDNLIVNIVILIENLEDIWLPVIYGKKSYDVEKYKSVVLNLIKELLKECIALRKDLNEFCDEI